MIKFSNKSHRWVKIQKSGSLTIFFKYQKHTYQFAPVSRGRFDNPQDIAIANRVASEIEQSVKLGKFTGLEPWLSAKIESEIGIEQPPNYTLTEIWQQYKIAKADKVSKSSQVSVWLQVDRCLEYVVSKFPLIGKAYWDELKLPNFIRALESNYSTQVFKRTLEDLHAACNFALKRKLISSNPLAGYKDYLPESVKSNRSKECYSLAEVNLILDAFYRTQHDVFPIVKNAHHYTNFVEFLFLTGVRPQLAIALTWSDVKEDKIIFNKGFTNGVLTKGKTGRVTHYPLHSQLRKLMAIYSVHEKTNTLEDALVFPSPTGNYINLKNFTCRIWKPLITQLVQQGKLSKYLPTYHCRHSTATFLAKAGIPSSTIAALLDTSEVMLSKHYLDNQELTNVVIPDLLAR